MHCITVHYSFMGRNVNTRCYVICLRLLYASPVPSPAEVPFSVVFHTQILIIALFNRNPSSEVKL